MSIRSFFKPKDGLPDPNGALSTSLPSQAIALANKEVEKATTRSIELVIPPVVEWHLQENSIYGMPSWLVYY